MEVPQLAPGWCYEYIDLKTWVAKATDGLCQSAIDRVREEISDHYAQVIDELCGDSVPGTTARAKAILRLGHPKLANRRYRKVYVTKKEEWRLKITNWKSQPLWGKASLVYVLFFFQWDYWERGHQISLFAFLFVFVSFFVIPKLVRYGWKVMQCANLCGFLAFGIYWAASEFLTPGTSIAETAPFLLIVAAVSTFFIRNQIKLISKLGTYPAPPDKWGNA